MTFLFTACTKSHIGSSVCDCVLCIVFCVRCARYRLAWVPLGDPDGRPNAVPPALAFPFYTSSPLRQLKCPESKLVGASSAERQRPRGARVSRALYRLTCVPLGDPGARSNAVPPFPSLPFPSLPFPSLPSLPCFRRKTSSTTRVRHLIPTTARAGVPQVHCGYRLPPPGMERTAAHL